jgi:RNA polymerase sigma-70 factor (ECF subfamily)
VRALPQRYTVDPPTDAELLQAIRRDDLGALGVLYDRHAKAVWRVVARVTNGASDVDDIVHLTFLKVPELAAGFDGRPSARGWLCGIAVRLALRHTRTLGRFGAMLRRFAHVTWHENQLDPEVLAIGRSQIALLESAVRDLSAAKRAVFVLIEVEGLRHDEVARDLGIPAATVRSRLFHAKEELRNALEKAR